MPATSSKVTATSAGSARAAFARPSPASPPPPPRCEKRRKSRTSRPNKSSVGSSPTTSLSHSGAPVSGGRASTVTSCCASSLLSSPLFAKAGTWVSKRFDRGAFLSSARVANRAPQLSLHAGALGRDRTDVVLPDLLQERRLVGDPHPLRRLQRRLRQRRSSMPASPTATRTNGHAPKRPGGSGCGEPRPSGAGVTCQPGRDCRPSERSGARGGCGSFAGACFDRLDARKRGMSDSVSAAGSYGKRRPAPNFAPAATLHSAERGASDGEHARRPTEPFRHEHEHLLERVEHFVHPPVPAAGAFAATPTRRVGPFQRAKRCGSGTTRTGRWAWSGQPTRRCRAGSIGAPTARGTRPR